MLPVVATMAGAEPLIIPIRPQAMTPTFAGPPAALPTRDRERSLIKRVKPLRLKKAPKRQKTKMYVVLTPIPVPKIPWLLQKRWPISLLIETPPCPRSPGMYLPIKL